MNPVIYQISGPLVDGQYLPGHYEWTGPVQLIGFLLQGMRPASGTLQLKLEIDGVLTDYAMSIASSADAFTPTFTTTATLLATVPANQKVRFLASFDGLPEQAASGISLTLTVAPAGTVGTPALVVKDGWSGIVCYTYDPLSSVFTKVAPSGFAPAWAIVQSGLSSFSLQFNDVEVFAVKDGEALADFFVALGGTASTVFPQAQFWVGNDLVATVNEDGGFIAANVSEGTPAALSELDLAYWNQFEFWSGSLTAVLNANGLTAASIDESNTP